MKSKDYKLAQKALEILHKNHLESESFIKSRPDKKIFTGDIGMSYLELVNGLGISEKEFNKYLYWLEAKEFVDLFYPNGEIRLLLNNKGALYFYEGGFKEEWKDLRKKRSLNSISNIGLIVSLILSIVSLYRTF